MLEWQCSGPKWCPWDSPRGVVSTDFCLIPRGSDSTGLEWSPRICTANEFPGDTVAHGCWTPGDYTWKSKTVGCKVLA